MRGWRRACDGTHQGDAVTAVTSILGSVDLRSRGGAAESERFGVPSSGGTVSHRLDVARYNPILTGRSSASA